VAPLQTGGIFGRAINGLVAAILVTVLQCLLMLPTRRLLKLAERILLV
jgi:hypothetical protein